MASLTIPEQALVWKIGGKPGNVRSQNQYVTNSGYSLFCETNKEYLTYVKQPVGINVGYKKDSKEKKAHLMLPDGKEREILTGEPFALGIGGGDAFLYYASREWGVNLKWSRNPVFEWCIYLPGGEKGKLIPTGSRLAIVNLKVKPKQDFLIYLDRPTGADIGWITSANKLGKLVDAGVKGAKIAGKIAL